MGRSPLIIASDQGYKYKVKLLIENGADINLQDKDGDTALMWASNRSNKDVVEILIENGADINLKNKDGDTALILASNRRNQDIVELLIENGAILNININDEATALSMAKLLIENKADINIQTNDGITNLTISSLDGHKHIVKLLIEKVVVRKMISIDGITYQSSRIRINTWNEAQYYAENLKSNGHNDWRLPTMNELNKLKDLLVKSPQKAPEIVGRMPINSYFWIALENKENSSGSLMDLANGGYDDRRDHYYALCVRG